MRRPPPPPGLPGAKVTVPSLATFHVKPRAVMFVRAGGVELVAGAAHSAGRQSPPTIAVSTQMP